MLNIPKKIPTNTSILSCLRNKKNAIPHRATIPVNAQKLLEKILRTCERKLGDCNMKRSGKFDQGLGFKRVKSASIAILKFSVAKITHHRNVIIAQNKKNGKDNLSPICFLDIFWITNSIKSVDMLKRFVIGCVMTRVLLTSVNMNSICFELVVCFFG